MNLRKIIDGTEGKMVIPVYKEKTNYFVIRDDESSNKIYFSLE